VFKVYIRQSDLNPPTEPSTRIESAVDCDGTVCGCAVLDSDGNTLDIPPHFHLVESQDGAGTRRYGIGGELP
jgi:hypothetical protein